MLILIIIALWFHYAHFDHPYFKISLCSFWSSLLLRFHYIMLILIILTLGFHHAQFDNPSLGFHFALILIIHTLWFHFMILTWLLKVRYGFSIWFCTWTRTDTRTEDIGPYKVCFADKKTLKLNSQLTTTLSTNFYLLSI